MNATTTEPGAGRYRVYYRKATDPKAVYVWRTVRGAKIRDEAMRECVLSGGVVGVYSTRLDRMAVAEAGQLNFLDALAVEARGTLSGNATVVPDGSDKFTGKPASGRPAREAHQGH